MKLRRLSKVLLGLCIVLCIAPYLFSVNQAGIPPERLAQDGGTFLEIDGLKTYVVERGNVQGTPILFMHGLFGSTYSLRYQINALAENGYRVIAYDRPGFGLTDKPYGFNYSLANHADFAEHVLDALGVQQAIILGHSAGGGVLVQFALRHPNRVAQLVIVDGFILGDGQTTPVFKTLLSLPPLYRWAQLAVRLYVTRNVLAGALKNFYADELMLTDDTISGYWKPFTTTNWEHGGLGHFRDATDGHFTDKQLASITAKTSIIWGEKDTVTVLADGKRLAQLLPNASLQTIPNAGHLPMEEAPEQFNQLLFAALAAPARPRKIA